MSWVLAILLALACFGAIAFLFGVRRKGWAALGTALALGLAGYGFQASPGLPGSPRVAREAAGQDGWALVDLRKEMVGDAQRSRNPLVITADALARKGQFGDAAGLLRGVVRDNPRDGDAWLALGNALSFHADGALTPAALYAYRQAAQAAPETAGPAFFVGWALIRQGQLPQGRDVWASALASLPEDAQGRAGLAQRLANLDALLQKIDESRNETAR